jgi:formylglycine-generating enzyme required for sulfatase activity
MSKITTTILLGLILTQPVLSATPRTALVIGNAAYQDGPLSAPVRDARALAKVLRKLGFHVIEKFNLDRKGMTNAIRAFGRQLRQRPGVGLFYFSGHGLQDEGANYLIPIGASESLKEAYDLPYETVSVDYVLKAMTQVSNAVNLVFLDACRTPPSFVKSWAKGQAIPPGMAKQSDVPGSLIAYAAAPGKPALDGKNGQNSPYVKQLLKWIQVPNLSIADALTEVRMAVIKATHGQQQPQYSNALNEKFSFSRRTSPADKISCLECPQLLRTCQRHFKANRLTTGRGGTALDCYSDVLKKDRNNGEALRGLEKIEAKYVAWIERALSRKQKNKVLQYMAGLRKVNPESPKLAAFEEQMQVPTPPIYTPQTVTVRPRQAGQVFRDRLKDGSKGPQMVWIAAGSFQMGDIQGGGYEWEKPVHKVNITKYFGMGRYEVTVGEFRQFVNATGYRTEAEKGNGCYIYKKNEGWSNKSDANWRNPYFSQNDNYPVVCISWNDAVAYTKWLSQQTGKTYRLPTEAEWEYVARAGTSTKYWWGNSIGSNKGNCSNSGDRFEYTAPVGFFKANPFKIYDTVGNVWEWTQDIYSYDYYSNSIYSDPKGPSTGSIRVIRGGGWYGTAPSCRAANRNISEPGDRYSLLGFRLLRL